MTSFENINQIVEDENFSDENGISLNNKTEINNNHININNKIPTQIMDPSPKAMPLVIFENGKFIIPKEAKELLNKPSFLLNEFNVVDIA